MTTHVTAPNDSNTRRKSPDPVSGGRSRWGGHNVCNMGRKERGKGEQQSERDGSQEPAGRQRRHLRGNGASDHGVTAASSLSHHR